MTWINENYFNDKRKMNFTTKIFKKSANDFEILSQLNWIFLIIKK